jgi:hypothetical protein
MRQAARDTYQGIQPEELLKKGLGGVEMAANEMGVGIPKGIARITLGADELKEAKERKIAEANRRLEHATLDEARDIIATLSDSEVAALDGDRLARPEVAPHLNGTMLDQIHKKGDLNDDQKSTIRGIINNHSIPDATGVTNFTRSEIEVATITGQIGALNSTIPRPANYNQQLAALKARLRPHQAIVTSTHWINGNNGRLW